jgi:hypothetical protein
VLSDGLDKSNSCRRAVDRDGVCDLFQIQFSQLRKDNLHHSRLNQHSGMVAVILLEPLLLMLEESQGITHNLAGTCVAVTTDLILDELLEVGTNSLQGKA